MYRQKGDTVFCHNCLPQVRQCNNMTGNTGKPHCNKCNKDGHADEQCWLDSICTNCGKKGHIARYCKGGTSKKVFPGKKGYRSECGRCGSTAHKSEDCPMYGYERLMVSCPVCENYYGSSYWHSEKACMVKKMLLRPNVGN